MSLDPRRQDDDDDDDDDDEEEEEEEEEDDDDDDDEYREEREEEEERKGSFSRACRSFSSSMKESNCFDFPFLGPWWADPAAPRRLVADVGFDEEEGVKDEEDDEDAGGPNEAAASRIASSASLSAFTFFRSLSSFSRWYLLFPAAAPLIKLLRLAALSCV